MDEKILNILQGMQKQLTDFQSQMTDMQKQMTDMQGKLAEHDKRFDVVESKLAEHDKRFDAVESKLSEHDRRFDHLEVKIEKEIKLLGDELHTEIQAVNDNVEALREDFIALEVATAKNTFDIAKFKLVR